MAKKHSHGRVTPKGTQPAGSTTRQHPAEPARFGPRPGPDRFAAKGRGNGPSIPTRAGHHRGNR